jgi:endonuclease YncB( thermonuclease family)
VPRTRHLALASLLLLCLPPVAAADEFRGRVLAAAEGDLLTVVRDGKPASLRLLDADCPEKGQPFGAKAAELASKLVLGKTVKVRGFTDAKGQLVGKVTFEKIEVVEVMRGDRVAERRTKMQSALDEELIRAGLAWSIPGRPPGDDSLLKLEKEARDGKRGLWADAGAIAPWEWRQGKRTASKPAAIRIANRGRATVVVDLTPGRQALSCEEKRGEKWAPCTILQPFCMASCAQKGCPECAKPRPSLVHLAPEKGVDVAWSGQLYRIRPFDHRHGKNVYQCSCYDAYDPPAGRYRIGLCLEPRGRGGPRVCHSVEVQLPASGPIEIAIPR